MAGGGGTLSLDRPPHLCSPRQRDVIADGFIAMVRELESYAPAREPLVMAPAALAKWDGPRLDDLVAEMTPFDRGLSRFTERLTLPATLDDAMRRASAAAQRKVDALVRASHAATRRAWADYRRSVITKTELQLAGDGPLSASMEQSVRRAIDTELRTLGGALGDEFRGLARRAVAAGSEVVDSQMRLLDLPIPAPLVPDTGSAEALLGEMHARHASRQMEELLGIVAQVRRGDLGKAAGLDRARLIVELPEHDAERIMRTEASRIAQEATADRMGELASMVTGVRSQWISALMPTTRRWHAKLHRTTVGYGELFDVGGEMTPYPKGPGLSAKNAVSCLCLVRPAFGPNARVR